MLSHLHVDFKTQETGLLATLPAIRLEAASEDANRVKYRGTSPSVVRYFV